ncbi:MAG: ATP-dependent sacrificial sulfur transferase LarE [Bacteroidales bacterium]|jgi:uncharacterized protein|nr:ATP-dependent sacrificial sulfur transferase LarE [Bacteroidales bacterium]
MKENKSRHLTAILEELKSFVIAFSGGVDSTFLAWMASRARGCKMTTVTIRTPYMPEREIREAVEFTTVHGISNTILDIDFPEIIRHNPPERCYLCKSLLFSKITAYAESNGYRYILDGTNADDLGDDRPGLKALRELSVRSPLAEAGITKQEIREYLREDGLTVWDKPAMACLLTRIPYGTEVKEGILRMTERAEEYLLQRGYPGTRVRVHGDVARIECMPGYLLKLANDTEREQIVADLKNLGFRYISLDLEGYRSGSMNTETRKK